MPSILHDNGVHSHKVTDHLHYWEDGGATYHHRYSSWENVRGQEGDKWKGEVTDPIIPEHLGRVERQDWINRKYLQNEESTPQAQTFARGIEFIKKNRRADNWSLQIETFDPHEPYFTLNKWKGHYPHKWDGPHFDWPKNQRVEENPEAVCHLKYEYASLLTQCDHYLGLVLDLMDEYGLWEDTMLIVNTDHGFLLGEHDWWAKCRMPFYNEIANIPLFIWDPRSKKAGERRSSLTQTIDVGPNLMIGREDLNLIKTTSKVRRLDIVPLMITERERQASFFTTGGLMAVHSNGRDRNSIWDSMQKKAVYGTSGDRILLWFNTKDNGINPSINMGGEVTMTTAPEFEVTAIGAFEQKPGCPDYTLSLIHI